jgi:hypothetical protein
MCSFDWEKFLRQWSLELLESWERNQETLPPEVITSGWLGYPGATEAQIVRAETRLGISLPPSYREFLKVTNGWRRTTPFIDHLWSTREIEWFQVRHQQWIDQFTRDYALRQQPDASVNGAVSHPKLPCISDQDYLVYGNDQHCLSLRLEYLQTSLEISDKGESSIYLLNPRIIREDGEWEAWLFGNWLPGADRYQSFQDMMQAEYQNFLELREL